MEILGYVLYYGRPPDKEMEMLVYDLRECPPDKEMGILVYDLTPDNINRPINDVLTTV